MTADNEPLDHLGMLKLAKAQYEETLNAVHRALDHHLGRGHRTRDDSAAASIRRLAAEGEKRGKVKALRAMANELAEQGQTGWATRLHGQANRIESGEVTLP